MFNSLPAHFSFRELATCDFHILPDAYAAIAPLTIEFLLLGDDRGQEIPAVGLDGVILITDVTPGPSPTPTATRTATPTRVPPTIVTSTPTLTPITARCSGDCNGDRQVTIEELIRGVGIALGIRSLIACPMLDVSQDGTVSIAELINAIKDVLMGC